MNIQLWSSEKNFNIIIIHFSIYDKKFLGMQVPHHEKYNL